jgi:hypothetical protein
MAGDAMMGTRRKLSGDECDAFSRRSRDLLCVFNQAGVASKTKRRFRKKVRQDHKKDLRKI